MRNVFLGAAFAAAVLIVTPAFADEVEDQINEALKAYASGDLAAAKLALDDASQMIAAKNAGALGAVLPEALSGWTAADVESNAAGAAMFGGGIQAGRKYEKDGQNVEVNIMGDSPMLATVMPMLANSALAAAMGKVTKIGKNRALQTKDGQIMLVVGNRFLVTIDGSGSMEDKTAYANAIDFDKLEAL
ncbi:hypothetical protein IZ6_26820 [Terrihabitans soli]|uniref:Uncharacterized protein n=1 Tax=Terrihabitans soli TaxID=708113 RepID=A0A6S6QVJ1_9HYPH|nr:hypothetical protein [Terrihabitans soli]BCJ91947.1 hypothetical protein IZ6_26820 [Terrihabitans soli]